MSQKLLETTAASHSAAGRADLATLFQVRHGRFFRLSRGVGTGTGAKREAQC